MKSLRNIFSGPPVREPGNLVHTGGFKLVLINKNKRLDRHTRTFQKIVYEVKTRICSIGVILEDLIPES